MPRSSSLVLLLPTLLAGVALGAWFGRGASTVSAQASGRPEAAGPSTARPVRNQDAPRGTTDEVYDQLARQYAQFEHVNRTFEMVSQAVSPAVVHIVAEKTGRLEESSRVRHYEETGSGVIARGDRVKNLYVLTNNHVVEGASPAKISIFLQDGRAIHPSNVWLDAKADIAVLNLGREDLPYARLGNSDDVSVGSWVMAMGSPFGLTHSVSQGIISARGRHMDELQDVENQDFLQTDAAINPGNSGGPLVNMKGEVIGINNSIASNGGGNEGVGFSIPINLARWIMTQLVAKGHVSRGALGIDLHPDFRPEDALALGLDRPHGAWVDVVHPASPAAVAGLHNDDVILRFQGVEVHDLNHLINLVSMAAIGQPADLVVWRARQSLNLRVTVGERDRAAAQVAPASSRGALTRRPERPAGPSVALGAELASLDEATATRNGLPANLRGALVVRVAPNSPLQSILKPFDVVYSVNDQAIASADDAVKALGASPNASGLTIGYDRLVKGAVERRSVRVP